MLVLTDLSFYKNLIREPVEVCGNFNIQNGFLFVDNASLTRGTETTPRSCTHIREDKYIFHTHPSVSKAYPSMTDIRKVIQKQSITYSIIFTVWGIWVLQMNGRYRGIPDYLPNVEKAGHNLYYNSGNGRVVNFAAIEEYISIITDMYPRLHIKFYEWDLEEANPNEMITI